MYKTIKIFSKELWFPGMGADYMVYRLITGKQYQKVLTRDSRCFQWIKIPLFKSHLSFESCIN